MLEHILIPVDGSELSAKVLAPLRHMLGGDEVGQATLLRVLAEGADDAEAKADLERLAGLLSASGVEAHQRVAHGDPSQTIVETAQQLDAKLVAMATHGRGGLTRLLRGSVAERVLRSCPLPLLLCNPQALDDQSPTEGFTNILVPHDGSDLADRILDPVITLARAYGAVVHLIKVENFATDGHHAELRDPQTVAATLDPAKQRLESAGVTEVHVHTPTGGEADEILKAADKHGIDLLALTTHGRSGVSRWWFGSVAEALVRHAPCPLFVLRVGS